MYDRLEQFLKHYGYQERDCDDLNSFAAQIGPRGLFVAIEPDQLRWFVPQEQMPQILEMYRQAPFFSSEPKVLDSELENRQEMRIPMRIMTYDHFLHLVDFLQSGLVCGYFRGGKAYSYHNVILEQHLKSFSSDESDVSVEEFLKAKETDPNDAILNNYLGKLFIESGDFDKAAGCFVDSFESAPYFAEPFSNLGTILWNADEKEKAFQLFSQALIRNPFDETVQDNFIGSGIELGQIESMKNTVTEVENCYPDYDGLLYLKAILLESLNQKSEALKTIESYLERHHDDERALDLKEKLSA